MSEIEILIINLRNLAKESSWDHGESTHSEAVRCIEALQARIAELEAELKAMKEPCEHSTAWDDYFNDEEKPNDHTK